MEQRTRSCPSCHRGIFAEDAFCSWCGTRVQAREPATGDSRRSLARQTIPTGERTTCGSCHSPILPGDLFCSTCGARYGAEVTDAGFGDSWTSIPTRVAEGSGGKYEFVRELGRGGMGIVFMARDLELDRPVAIKVLSPTWLTDDAMVQRFQREARVVASLRHESIVSVYDVGRAGDLHYFVMDYIEGVSLSRILRTYGRLPIPAVESILYRVGHALSYAHRPGRRIVHRDIKPSNIVLDTEGLPVVMDFGISKVSETPSGLTRTGLVMGTPEYMSPEQCRGHTVTHESDQYSLGCVVYAMLTGAPPFTGPFYQVLMAHQTEPVPSVLDVRPDCPPDLAAATERMLGKLPGDRWPDIRDAIKALGLRPLPPDDPVIEELATLVRRTAQSTRSAGGGGRAETRRTPTAMRIMPHPDDLEVGDEVSLVATLRFPDGAEEPGREVTWETTDPSIVRVDPTTGQLVAVSPGSALVSAAGVGLKEMVAVEVKPPQVVQIAIEPGDVELTVGTSARLTAEPRSKRGQSLPHQVHWSSSDPRTASVTDDGVVTAKRSGTVSVLAHCEGVGGATLVRVVEDASERTPAAVTVPSSRTPPERRTPPPHPPADQRTPPSWGAPPSGPTGEGAPTPSPPPPAAQRKPRPRALVVGLPAAVVLLGAGALWWANRPAPPVAVAEVDILGSDGMAIADPLRIMLGDTVTLTAAAADAEGAVLDRPVSWQSTDPAVASVDPGGVLIALARGDTRVRASADGVSRELAVAVDAEPADVVLRTEAGPAPVRELDLGIGEAASLVADVTDRNGQPMEGQAVTWRSSSSAVAQVDRTGRVTGRAAGRAVITASAGSASREVTVSVSGAQPPPPPANGRLVLRIVPSWANVYIDGVSQGEQTGLDMRIVPGRHRLRLENPTMIPVDTIFEVRPGARVELNIRMRMR